MDIQIRKALPADLDVLMDIFEVARRFMQATAVDQRLSRTGTDGA